LFASRLKLVLGWITLIVIILATAYRFLT